MPDVGAKQWAIAEGYIPPGSRGQSPEFLSHEALCMLNATDRDAHVIVTIYFRRPRARRSISSHGPRAAHAAPAF